MYDITELLPYEQARKSGAWCDIKHEVTGQVIGRVRVLQRTNCLKHLCFCLHEVGP